MNAPTREEQIEWVDGLLKYLRIPSVSTLPEYAHHVHEAAEFTRQSLQDAGLSARLIEGDGYPLVYAEWLGAPGKPTVLFYGHYDVQPAEPLEEWHSPPFEPEIRNDNVYARGAADDKGQVYLQIKAVEWLLKETGTLPVNVRFLIEGEEETGGHHIESFVSEPRPELQADVAIICDTELFAPGLPTLCVGLRGIVYGELTLKGARQDLHSGTYGGVAPNPLQAMAEVIAAIKDREGHIRIPGIYDDVLEPTEEEREAWDRLPFDEEEYREKEIGAPALTGYPGVSVFARTWSLPTFEVHGIRGGYTGEGAKTVIPAEATAKLSMRIVPNQDPQRVTEQLVQTIREVCPEGVTASFRLIHGAPPSMVDPSHPSIRLAAQALESVFGQPTVYVRAGGSIPIVGLFNRHLRIPSVMMGFGLPDDNLHAPNEKFHLPNFFRGVMAIREYLRLLGQ